MAISKSIIKDTVTNNLKKKVNTDADKLSKYFSKKELKESAKELKYMQSHIKDYEKNNNWEDLQNEILKKI